MSMLGKVARATGLRKDPPKPVPPVATLDWFPTFALSVDAPPVYTKRLLDIALNAVRSTINDVSLDDLGKREDFPDWALTWPGEHYRLLGGLMLTLKPRVVIELGTDKGISALAMLKYLPPGSKLITFDIVPWQQVPDKVLRTPDFADGRLQQRLADLSEPTELERHRELLESADFFFIDAPKDNVFEYKLLENLKALRFKQSPILMFDDTRLLTMLKLWNELQQPKLDISSFGHWSGTGLVEWAPAV